MEKTSDLLAHRVMSFRPRSPAPMGTRNSMMLGGEWKLHARHYRHFTFTFTFTSTSAHARYSWPQYSPSFLRAAGLDLFTRMYGVLLTLWL